MAIYSVELDEQNSAESSINEKFEVEYTRNYVVVSDLADDELFVRTNLGISLFSAHPSDALARCKSIHAGRVCKFFASDIQSGNLLALWKATVSWGYINPFQANESGDPADCPIEVSIETITEAKPLDLDKDGNPVVNSAGDYFDPPLETDDLRIRINISRYEKSVSPSNLILNYANRVNAVPWQSFPERTVKCSITKIVPYYSQFLSIIRYQVQYAFDIKPETWTSYPLDQGYRQLDAATNKLQEMLDEYGVQPSTPFFLDGNGKALAPPIDKDSIVQLEFKGYYEADFNDFNFPENIMVTNPFG